ncbi:lipid-A-disaccharide synthase [Bacteroidetes/Chlorobi group bacterium Naka2016]|jgi:lipid-A-disaccharide synthase|nr:MAG: lipid-A-disaccharide synthase [Bacteroidetes/Chlorobi group bacterium Naka2016]
MNSIRVFIVAGESSGDLHASKLMHHLKKILPEVSFIGIGGKRMEEVGLRSIVPLERVSVVGFAEVIKNINFFRQTLKKCKNVLENEKIDIVVLVDFPGFNIRIAEIASSLKIPVCYYIAPQLWAWGKKRVHKLKEYVDLLLVVFPFEQDFFSQYLDNVEFVGHPLLDEPIFQNEILGLEKRENSIAILPGSRKSEISYHKKLVFEIIELLQREFPEFSIKIPELQNSFFGEFAKELKTKYQQVVFEANSYNVLSRSKVGIIKSGTSNLEAALLGLPFVMFYKTSFATYFIAKQLVELNYISIVNVLLNSKFVPEFIQREANSKNIVGAIKDILTNQEIYIQMQSSFSTIKQILGGSGASERAAKKIVEHFRL